MSILNDLIGQVTENADVANLAAKVGLSPEHVESAIAALAKFHPMAVDTAEGAAAETGLPLDKLQEIIGHLGGEGSIGRFASLLGEQDGIAGQLGGLAKGLFGNS